MDIVCPDPDEWLADWQLLMERAVAVVRETGQNVNFLALPKGKEKYIFLYTDNMRGEVMKVLKRYAKIDNQTLSLTWYDAALLSTEVCQEAQRALLAKNEEK